MIVCSFARDVTNRLNGGTITERSERKERPERPGMIKCKHGLCRHKFHINKYTHEAP